MEQIRKVDGKLYYGEIQCKDADEAYRRFREDYHKSIGRAAYKRLNRLGSRKERMHGSGFVFSTKPECPPGIKRKVVPIYIMGIIAGSYCKSLSGQYIPDGTDEEIDQWIDWAFSKGSGALRVVGKKWKTGRTSKNYKKHR